MITRNTNPTDRKVTPVAGVEWLMKAFIVRIDAASPIMIAVSISNLFFFI
jgi:hypothetical protein